MICNDVLKSPAGQNFSHFSEKVKTFNSLCSEFLLGLQGTLATKLPSIRGGGEEEAALAEVLKRAAESPFSSHRLNQWMNEVVKETNTIKVLTNLMRNTEVVSSENDLMKKMASDCNSPVEMAALGRSFLLGMLYDCRSDTLVPGLTFWDQEKLDKDMRVTPKPSTQCQIVASDHLSEKASSLGVDAGLKASFMSGLVKVEGSAKYLNDQKSSRRQARVTLQYKTTTEFKTLTMNQLSKDNLKHHEVIDKGLATHVVTAILYGAQAFFVFDQETSEDENVRDIQGNLKVMIEKIPKISIDGEGNLKMEDKDKEKVNKFSCTFHGDFCLDKSPTTFEEAVKVYQDLPKRLGPKGENAVPVRVHLLPLSALDSAASKLVRHISLRLVCEAENVLENFRELDMICNDVLKSPVGQNFSHFSKKVKTFNSLCSEFLLGLQGTLAMKLPSIRGGGEEEAALAEVLKRAAESPFSSHRLNQWMDEVTEEANAINALTNLMRNTEVVSSKNDLMKKVRDSEKVLVFVFTSLERAEPYLEELKNHLQGIQTHESGAEPKPWYKTKDMIHQMRLKAKVFRDFADANKDQDTKALRFLAVGLTDENHKEATIYLYEDGFLSSESFELPSKPDSVTVSRATAHSVSLQVRALSVGAENVCGYRVEFCEKGQEQWKQQLQAEAGEVTVTGLIPNTEYSFTVRAVTEAGVGPAAPHTSMKTLPCDLPENPSAMSTSSKIYVRWRRPAQVGQGAQILRYIVEYAETGDTLQWRREESHSEEKVISGLKPQTEYILRIFCDYGENGTSSESSTVTITTKTFTAAELIVKDSVKIKSGTPEIYKLGLKAEKLRTPRVRKYVFGKESHKENRIMILLGPVGSGKISLIDAMINYILGVRWTDPFWFKINEGETSETVVYQINHQEGFQVDFSLTIIDTPEFRDFTGITGDKQTLEQIAYLVNDLNITEVHTVCVVVQSSLAQLPPALCHVLHSFHSSFGKDVFENLKILVTFADAQMPPVLEYIKAAGVPCPKTEQGLPVHFKFNNSAMFAPNQTSAEEDNLDQMFWDMGNKNMTRFFSDLEKTQSKRMNPEIIIVQLLHLMGPQVGRVMKTYDSIHFASLGGPMWN
ncbi:uncharacterized protein LOC110175830 isoform X1 [Boleophthalmus pectinirostris]|uniref:uncharacterized protein LOC110175830 isoform X1 n=2 Tax=Boleophthalmus pectinirostris TaxID=150288 RepID=UPI00242D1B87|nr:uncharacterized protein LOC110175830 isoform X1 [Boleophthalmus pectinirostris]